MEDHNYINYQKCLQLFKYLMKRANPKIIKAVPADKKTNPPQIKKNQSLAASKPTVPEPIKNFKGPQKHQKKQFNQKPQTNMLNTKENHSHQLNKPTEVVKQAQNTEQIYEEIIRCLEKIDFNSSFQIIQSEFMSLIKQRMYFLSYKPISRDQIGEKLAKDGIFISLWCKLLIKNPYVNEKILLPKVFEESETKMQTNKDKFTQFIAEQVQKTYKQEMNKRSHTPIKRLEDNQNLLLQSSRKGYQMTYHEYSKLKSGKKSPLIISKQHKQPTIEQLKQTAKFNEKYSKLTNYDLFLIEFLEIKDLFYFKQIQLVAILQTNYKSKDLYSIVLVKLRSPPKQELKTKEYLSIMNLKSQGCHDQQLLKEISQTNLIEAFIINQEHVDLMKEWMNLEI